MRPLDFLFAKLFDEYRRKRDLPKLSITLYISIVYFFLLFCLYLPISVMINKVFFNNELEYDRTPTMMMVFSTLGLITFLTYKKYIKNEHIFYLSKKYKSDRISKFLLYTLVALIPVTLLLLGGTLTVLLTGGRILNNEFEGLINR